METLTLPCAQWAYKGGIQHYNNDGAFLHTQTDCALYIYIIPPYDPDKTGIVSLDSQLEEVSWCFEPSQPKGLLNQDWFEEVNQLVYPERRVQDEGSVRAKPKSFTCEGQTDHSRPTSLYVKTASGREGAGR